jgi:[ribosomal protein S5]-alanine N-acetyltransferase
MLTDPLLTERLVIRTAGVAEAPSIAAYYRENRAHLAPWEPRRTDEFFTETFWSGQLARDEEEARSGRQLRLFFVDRAEPARVIGTANFSQMVRGVFHACVLGYSIGERFEGRGYMRERLTASLAFIFEEVRLHRIQANYMPRNVRSGRLLRSMGFVVEGYARDYLLIADTWEDHVLTSLTNPFWRPIRLSTG